MSGPRGRPSAAYRGLRPSSKPANHPVPNVVITVGLPNTASHLQVVETAGTRGSLRLLARRNGGLDLALELLQPLLRQSPQVLRLQQRCGTV